METKWYKLEKLHSIQYFHDFTLWLAETIKRHEERNNELISVSYSEAEKMAFAVFKKNVSSATITRVQDEVTAKPKFIPSHDELIRWGFIPIQKQFSSYTFKKVIGIEQSINYTMSNNNLWGNTNPSIPFHTKEDFMKVVGVNEIKNFAGNPNDWKCFNKKELGNYIPSEEILRELKFEIGDGSQMSLYLPSQRAIFYWKESNEFVDTYLERIFIYSDAELRMLVEVLGREQND